MLGEPQLVVFVIGGALQTNDGRDFGNLCCYFSPKTSLNYSITGRRDRRRLETEKSVISPQ